MTEKYYGWGLPVDISTHGAKIDQLINILHIFMAVLFAGWFIFLVTALLKFRARPGHQAAYKLNHFKAPTYLEAGVALFEVFLLAGFSYPLLHNMRDVPPPMDKALQIRIVAEQFAWNIHYPGPDGIFGKINHQLMNPSNPVGLDPDDPAGKDDITTINQLHIPVNQPVIARLTSKDVIHSFGIPVMRVKRDVIPGQEISSWFEANKAGSFEIACAQLCGLGHYRMRGFLTVDKPEDFKKWTDEQLALKLPPPPPVAVETAAAPVAVPEAQPEAAPAPAPETTPAPESAQAATQAEAPAT